MRGTSREYVGSDTEGKKRDRLAPREASLVNCVGMLPVSLLSPSARMFSRVKVDSSLGMVPEMALLLRSRNLRELPRNKGNGADVNGA